MSEAPPAERRPFPLAAVGFAAAAALCAWNPLSAPFGLFVGLGAVLLAARALWAGARRGPAAGALVLALGAMAASGIVLALTAGVGRTELGGTPVVRVAPREEQAAELDRAAERTQAARDRARAELEELERQKEGTPPGRKDARPSGEGRPP